MRFNGIVTAATLSGTLAGCVLLDPVDSSRPVHMHRTRAVRRASRAPTAQPVLPSPLTRSACIAFALANNPDVRRARWDVSTAGAEHDIAAGERWPSVRVVGSYDYSLDNQRLVPPRAADEPSVFGRNFFGGDLVLSMPLFTGGRITSETEATALLTQAADHRLARTREALVFNVTRVYESILAQRYVIEAIDFSTRTLEEHQQRIRDLIEVQKAARVDLLRTRVRLADLKQRRVSESNALAILKRVLVNLMGIRHPTIALDVEGKLASTPVHTDLDRSLARALAQRTDYRAAQAELDAQARRVDAARAARWPTVNLQTSYGLRHAADPTSQPSTADSTEDVGFVGITAELPVFEGGRITARIRREQSALGAAQERLRALELQIRLDVETADANLTAARERVTATQAAIDQARESLRIEREKYDLGRGSQTDVLDAQSAFVDSETSYYRALAEENIARAELRLAIGDPE